MFHSEYILRIISFLRCSFNGCYWVLFWTYWDLEFYWLGWLPNEKVNRGWVSVLPSNKVIILQHVWYFDFNRCLGFFSDVSFAFSFYSTYRVSLLGLWKALWFRFSKLHLLVISPNCYLVVLGFLDTNFSFDKSLFPAIFSSTFAWFLRFYLAIPYGF